MLEQFLMKGISIEVKNKVEEAFNLASNASSIAELEDAIKSFSGCPLKNDVLNTVLYDGNLNAKVLVIGEAPGAKEDIQGKPFVGRSGKLLDKILKKAGFERDKNILITNMFYWRPPNNRKPTKEELLITRPFVDRFIALIKPEILLLVGGTSASSMLKTKDGITKLRGKLVEYNSPWLKNTIKAMATIHPAFVLRGPSREVILQGDIEATARYFNQAQ